MLSYSLSLSAVEPDNIPNTLIEAATNGGGSVLENRYGRERWRSRSTISCRPVVKPPEPPPRALPRVDVKTSICQPDGVTRSQNADVFVKYLNNHPGELHLGGAELVVLALSEAFPCKGGK